MFIKAYIRAMLSVNEKLLETYQRVRYYYRLKMYYSHYLLSVL